MIHKERLYQHIHELGMIGKDNHGGVTRFPYTFEDEQAKDYIIEKMRDAKLEVHVDAVGNIIGRRKGRNHNLILCGSHIDTVKNGGNFDGCLGVLGAIEVLHTMEEQQLCLEDSVEVIVFKDEEGNRFSTGMVGSRSICGLFHKQDLDAIDAQGCTLQQAANEHGYAIEDYASCAYDFQNVKAYVELHIEQGSVLEKNQRSIGIVTGIAGLKRFEVSIYGISGHSGAIPMVDRVDPVIAFSKLTLYMNEHIKQFQDAVVTIGEIHVSPGACNVICESLTCSLDVRSLCMEDIESFMQDVIMYLNKLTKEGFTYQLQERQYLTSALCDHELQNIMQDHMIHMHNSSFSLMSGAGHDAMNFYEKCPMGMIFVRSKDGFSHRPEEYSSLQDCADGANLLFKTLVSISNRK